ncbi:hypothetical protein D3C74_348060 [compost metagenome]
MNIFILLIDDQHCLRDDVRIGKIIFFLAVITDRNLIGYNVESLGIKPRKNAIPFRFNKLGFHSQALGNLTSQLYIKAGQAAVFVMISKRCIRAFRTHANFTVCFNLIQ